MGSWLLQKREGSFLILPSIDQLSSSHRGHLLSSAPDFNPSDLSVHPHSHHSDLPFPGQRLKSYQTCFWRQPIGSRALLASPVTKEETRDRVARNEGGRGYLVLCGNKSICLCICGVREFIGHRPSRSAEAAAASVVAEAALKLLLIIYFAIYRLLDAFKKK